MRSTVRLHARTRAADADRDGISSRLAAIQDLVWLQRSRRERELANVTSSSDAHRGRTPRTVSNPTNAALDHGDDTPGLSEQHQQLQ